MKKINETVKSKSYPVRLLQFGEGNFLRGFIDQMIDVSNEAGVTDIGIVMVKPRSGALNSAFKEQEFKYTVSLRGLTGDSPVTRERIITSVSDVISCYDDHERFMEYAVSDDLRFIVSNTTEAGIVFDENDRMDMDPPDSFPGKLTKLLYARYKHFNGDRDKGLIILPLELISNNARVLESCVKKLADTWGIEAGFTGWLDEACIFCNTLVDRIISGYPYDEADKLREEWGYEDRLTVCGELFGLFIIEGDERVMKELPLDKAGLPVKYVKNIVPYKTRKVRILNGAHTGFSLWSYLKGHDTVLESMEDKEVWDFVNRLLFDEVIPTIELDEKELKSFARDVLSRFRNPFIRHELRSIALNSISKWRARLLPTMLDFIDLKGELPPCIVDSLAALLLYYRGSTDSGSGYAGSRTVNGRREEYEIMDDQSVISFLKQHEKDDVDGYIGSVLSNADFFGTDLLSIKGLKEAVTESYLKLNKACG
ncbi:MAG: tagaturonate reductase [Lachnospiraceae bacterium]|nr:tagaturonate reductase [Lachnospiraceae bacterium]